MESSWKNLRKIISYSEGGITSKVVEKSEFGDVTLFCMAADTDISDHTSTKAGYVYIIEGKGVFKLEKENILMEPGVMISMKPNAVHSLKAEENTSFILILRK